MKLSRLPLLFPLMLAVSAHAIKRTPEQQANIKKVLSYVHGKLATLPPPALRDDLHEHVIDGEGQAILDATEAIVKTVIDRAYTGETTGISKGDHGKTQACLTGTMTVDSHLPLHLQAGILVPGATYKVESRLSNAEHPGASDSASLSQGVALKLKNVSSVVGNKTRLPDFPNADEQDFLMTSSPTFFVKNIIQYNYAFQYRADGGATNMWNAISSAPGPSVRRLWDQYVRATLIESGWIDTGKPENILTHPYWSKHPYAWGERGGITSAVKYSVAPADCEKHFVLTKTSPKNEYQKEFIDEAFKKNGEICFYFRVQTRPPNATESSFPMENAKVEWSEAEAPFQNVAVIKFKAADNRDWSSKAKQTACGQTEFNPWNGLLAHQPLSNLSRGRRYVYKASALVREAQKELGIQVPQIKN